MKRYSPKEIEPKWQEIWDETNVYTSDLGSDKTKYIAMSMFNYPSGNLHIGHAMNFTISDVKARYKRQQGYESYHPVGWDSFGLPAENRAIKVGMSPQESMAQLIPDYRKAYKAMGWSNDWSKEISTHSPEYYKWTQWIFSEMFRNNLAYQDVRMQWWCTKCQTVLANEQVIDGKCWRHDGKDDPIVEKKEVKQWFFKITEYADELLEAIDDLDWTESVKLAQKNWIGKSVGAEITFKVDDLDEQITVFTTRADTLFGATFLVVAPECDIVSKITSESQKKFVEDYVKSATKKTEIERQAAKEKTGVFTGSYAINPINDEKIPIWVADYVLSGYGTGAIMAVPAHDDRDNEFAKKYDLPIKQVVAERFVDNTSLHRSDKELVSRNVVTCIIKHPEKEEYIIALPKGGVNWSPLMGGIDEGESASETAKRELIEETGYFDIANIKECGPIIASEFFAKHKDVNRIAYCQVVYIELKSLQVDEEKAIDKDEQEIKWVSENEYRSHRDSGGMNEVLDIALGNRNEITNEGRLINSADFNGVLSSDAREKIVSKLLNQNAAKEKVNYKMRDWSVSRQRYWGAPIPIVNCDKCGVVLVPDEQLPVILPELTDFKPSGDGRSALARATDWLKTTCPDCGGEAERETDTLDTYICSSWYMFRYFDPFNKDKIFDSKIVNKWAPIDFYNGGDHATAHLLYARFIARFFTKIGLVDNPEPFKQMLFNGKVVASDGQNFSKTLGNGPDPLSIIDQGYGADALRTYLMFAAPLELGSRWDPQGVPGAHRFLVRLWNLVQEYLDASESDPGDKLKADLARSSAAMIKKVDEDLEGNRYNTAIAAIMAGLNDLYKLKNDKFVKSDEWQRAIEAVVSCVAPFAPHIADELWQQLGHSNSIHKDSWPKLDISALVQTEVKIVVQVNGKVRSTVMVPADSDELVVTEAAKADEKVSLFLKNEQIKKTIMVPNKLINFVI
ncbi:leucine--tRNA ligase [Candidatus Nomurabacteria bacterium]|nr:leucine--tRNA ligase [Candidatus Nomurabacteria bacterium]